MSTESNPPLKGYPLKIKVLKTHPEAKLSRKTDGSSGFDICAVEKGRINCGQRKLVSTGIKLEIPKGFEAQVRSRSGLALNDGVVVCQGIGTIDSDYRGEVSVLLRNTDLDRPFSYKPGDRIAQIVFQRVLTPEIEEVTELQQTTRGEGGFGSTGK